MGIECLYNDGYEKGVRPNPEDGIIFCPRKDGTTVGMLDGVSFYNPDIGPSLFDGRTQGQLAVSLVQSEFLTAGPGEPIAKTLILANDLVREKAEQYGLSLGMPETLPGTAFAIAQSGTEKVSVVWGGDCGAVWLMKDGTMGGTENQAYDYEAWVERTFAAIKNKHGGDLGCAWEEWLPIRRKKIRQLQNRPSGWSTISGQPEFFNSWLETKLPREEVSLIILFTDGFVRFEDTKDPAALARKLIALYKQGGLGKILANTRASQRRHLPNSHEATCPEATAIAIKF